MAGESARTPGPAAWPEKMITQAEAFGLAASWPVFAVQPPESPLGDIGLYCGKCPASMGQLRRAGTVYNGSLDEMLSMVLRHMVMAHDVPLNNVRKVSE